MRVLFISAIGDCGELDIAMRAIASGHQVKWAFAKTEKNKDIGRGLVERVDDWRPWMRWADLVILGDNTKYLREIDAWRARENIPVVGATSEAAAWELNRTLGQKVFKKAGIDVLPYREFSRYDDAIAYVKRENRRFVSKPCGDEPDKSLSYVAKSPEDLVYMLERWKRSQRHKGSFILQEFVGGTEMAVGGWFGPGGFSEGWFENFEFKALMAGDRGPNCFTPDAEVLTKTGWKFWPDVTMDDEICTLKDGKIVYDRPSQIVVGQFDGDLIGWQSPSLDILVTPGHQMYVQDDHYRKPFFFEPADVSFTKRRTVMRSGGTWSANGSGDEAAWAALLGAYIADGSCRERSVVFGNCPAHKQKIFCEIAQAAGYKAKMYGPDLYINSKALVETLRPLGKALDKHVPDYVKQSSSQVIRSFLRGYGAGDGSSRHNNLIYTTISRRLADDLQELALKIGWASSINVRDRRDESHENNGYVCFNRHVSYDISIAQHRQKAEISSDNRYTQRYSGKVYCVTVPSHVIYVRRNGKPVWIGQTGEMGTVGRYVKRSKLADKVLKPLEDDLYDLGYCGYVDVNCIIDDAGNPWPLEFTMRFGWPTFNIQQALLKGDVIEWLAALRSGRDERRLLLNKPVCGAVMALPDFPYSHITRKEVTGVPVYGMTPALAPNIHPCCMMQGSAPQMMGGKITTAPMMVTAGDYVLVTTGVGNTVREARTKCYRVMECLKAPSSPFWRPDIGVRLKKQLPVIQAQGYATGMQF